MLLLYGDYKDLNYPGDYETSVPSPWYEHELEELRPYWMKFINGELNLKRHAHYDEWEECIWIDIDNNVFENAGCNTHYAILPAHITRPPRYSRHWEESDKYIDRDNQIFITERNNGQELSFEYSRKKNIEWNRKRLKEIAPWFNENYPEQASQFMEHDVQELERWKNKTERRWFY